MVVAKNARSTADWARLFVEKRGNVRLFSGHSIAKHRLVLTEMTELTKKLNIKLAPNRGALDTSCIESGQPCLKKSLTTHFCEIRVGGGDIQRLSAVNLEENS